MSWQSYADAIAADPNVDRAAILTRADGAFVASTAGFAVRPASSAPPARSRSPPVPRAARRLGGRFDCSGAFISADASARMPRPARLTARIRRVARPAGYAGRR